jgi:hypothetical protein
MASSALHRLRRSGARLGAGALVAVFLCAQLGGALHFAVVQHVSCAEHGELVEIGTDAGVRAAAVATHETVRADDTTLHGHDHCGVSAIRRERIHHVAPLALAARLPTTSLAHASLARRAPPRAIAILDLAPKSSPPRA